MMTLDVRIYIYIYIWIHLWVCIYVYMYISMYVCICLYVDIYVHRECLPLLYAGLCGRFTNTHTHKHAHTHPHTHTHTHTHKRTHTQTHTYKHPHTQRRDMSHQARLPQLSAGFGAIWAHTHKHHSHTHSHTHTHKNEPCPTEHIFRNFPQVFPANTRLKLGFDKLLLFPLLFIQRGFLLIDLLFLYWFFFFDWGFEFWLSVAFAPILYLHPHYRS